jgi:hypothetical protein
LIPIINENYAICGKKIKYQIGTVPGIVFDVFRLISRTVKLIIEDEDFLKKHSFKTTI